MSSRFIKKTAIIAVVVLVIALIPSFARGHNRMGGNYNNDNYNSYGHNGGNYNGSGGRSYNSSGGGCNGRGYNGYNSNSRHGRSGYQLGGTIQSIDTGASTISVANADGALTIVHLNPTTRIMNMTDMDTTNGYGRNHMDYFSDINTEGMTDAELRLEYFNARETAIEEWEKIIEDSTLAFSNLKTGDWVEVSTLSTGTLTREASVVNVYR